MDTKVGDLEGKYYIEGSIIVLMFAWLKFVINFICPGF